MFFPLAFEIEQLFQYLPVIVIFVLMILGSLLGNKQKQRQSEGEPEETRRGGGGQSWEEMLEDMLGGKTRTPPEAPRAEPQRQPQRPQPQRPAPPPIERPTARRQPPPARPAPPPPVPKRRPQKQRRSQPVSQGEIITGSVTLPPAPRQETSAPAPVPDRPSEAGQASAARMAVNDSEIGVNNDAYADRKRPTSDSADRLRKWLTPGTLRRDFLITEIFQPPVGLRDDRQP